MKKLVLIILMGIPMGLFAQERPKGFANELMINAISRDSIRIEVRRHEVVKIDLALHRKHNWLKTGLLSIAPMLVPSRGTGTHDDIKNKKHIPLNLGLLGSLSMIHAGSRKAARPIIEIKQYAPNGNLLKTELPSPNRNRDSYELTKTMDQDSYLIIAITNLEKQTLAMTSTINFASPAPPIGGIPGDEGGGTSDPESDEPIAWENYIDGVTIVGTGTFANNNFMANYEASFGPSETWIAVGGGSGDGGGSGGGDGGYEPPSAEAKAEARNLNKLPANKCEARYILEHASSDPMMLPKLITTRTYVENYMLSHNMGTANDNGATSENAFKHALYSARTYCEIGAQHASMLANLHETCDGVNRNPSEAERIMDNFNNNEGFKIAASVGCSSADALETAIKNAYVNGKLHKVNGTPTP